LEEGEKHKKFKKSKEKEVLRFSVCVVLVSRPAGSSIK